MRTTRVNPTTSSIFRNSRQYLQTNELVFKMMHDGSGGKQQQERQKDNKNQQNNLQTKTKVLKKTTERFAVRGLRFDTSSMLTMQNSVLKHSVKINTERNKQIRIRTYRTSI